MKRKSRDYDKLSEVIENKSKEDIIYYRKTEIKKSRTKTIIFYIIYVIITAFCFYYVMVFCAIYQGSSLNWLADGFIGILIFFVFKFLI